MSKTEDNIMTTKCSVNYKLFVIIILEVNMQFSGLNKIHSQLTAYIQAKLRVRLRFRVRIRVRVN